MKKVLFSFLFFSCTCVGLRGQTKKVLFIGNSYTAYNNLAQIINDAAISVGDSLFFDTHTPGGSRLMNHSSNPVVFSKIYSNNWDHIVIQGQSQEPSWDSAKVAVEVFPHAKILSDSARASDSCNKPIFYMTWGRENGDANNCAFWPWVCTYEGMDSVLNKNYRKMAADNDGLVSPVGALWKYIRTTHSNIQLYASDGSHPSASGSYAAAMSFYSIIFKKDPSAISYNFNLPAAEASQIRNAAKLIVFDSLVKWGMDTSKVRASFVPTIANVNQISVDVHFNNQSQNAEWYEWDFGDGNAKSVLKNPVHSYVVNGGFNVKLKSFACGKIDSITELIVIDGHWSSLNENEKKNLFSVFPNPSSGELKFEARAVDHISKLELLNSTGKVIKTIFKNQLYANVSLAEIPSGQYILVFHLEDGNLEYRSFQLIR